MRVLAGLRVAASARVAGRPGSRARDAAGFEAYVWGESGRLAAPDGSVSPVTALSTALRELVANARAGRSEHPCDVRFGREVGRVLAEAQRQIDAKRAGCS